MTLWSFVRTEVRLLQSRRRAVRERRRMARWRELDAIRDDQLRAREAARWLPRPRRY